MSKDESVHQGSEPGSGPHDRAQGRACQACGQRLRLEARFCDRCGAPIAPGASERAQGSFDGAKGGPPSLPAAATEELRTVTVLFADLKEFTRLSEDLDPDDVHDMVRKVFAVTDRIIEEQGGRIEKHMGDAVLALFGVPRAREDDPARAIRAALRFQVSVRELATRFEREGYPRVALRVGINTGRVALGSVGTDAFGEMSVWGDTVNVASRLQTACPPGGVLVSHETYRHVRGQFEVEAQPPIHAKGKRLPLTTYLVTYDKGEQSHIGTREVLGHETDLIGRDVEFGILYDAFARCVERRSALVVTIVGSAGMGKSRLLHEFLKRIEAAPRQVLLMRARATTESARQPYYLLSALVKASAGIGEQQSAAEARQRLEEWASSRLAPRNGGRRAYDPEEAPVRDAPYDGSYGEEAAHYIGELIGIPFPGSRFVTEARGDPQQIRQRAYLALERILERGARRAPLCIELEDIHWADGSSLDFFRQAVTVLAGLPLLVLAATRPEIRERDWLSEGPDRLVIRLSPLAEGEARQLAEHLLRFVDDVPPQVVEEIARRCGGTPYFAEEIVKNLADLGALQTDAHGYRFRARPMDAFEMPSTVEGILQARLDRLTSEELSVCRLAAVIGRAFWDCALAEVGEGGALADLLPQLPTAAAIPQVLESLRSREMVRLQPVSAFPPCAEYLFVHDLMRDVAYRSLVKRTRSRLHVLVARWLERRAGERSREWLATIASHYEAGGERRLAAGYYLGAGEAAADLYSNDEALRLFEKAVDVGELEGVSAARERLACARVRERIGDWDRALADLKLAAEAARGDREQELLSEILALASSVLTIKGRFDEGLAEAARARELAVACGSKAGEATALQRMARVHVRRGDTHKALELRRQALALRRGLGDEEGVADGLLDIAASSFVLGQELDAMAIYEQALGQFRALGRRTRVADILHNIALIYGNHGEYDRALRLYEESLHIRRATGDRPRTAWNLHNMASILLERGEWERVEAYNQESLDVCRVVGNRPGVGYCVMAIASMHAARGDLDAALEGHQQALDIFRSVGELPLVASEQESLAEIRRQRGETDLALALVDEAIELSRSLPSPDVPASALAIRADCLAQAGAIPEALSSLESALSLARERPSLPALARVMARHARVLALAGERAAAKRQAAAARVGAMAAPTISLPLSSLLLYLDGAGIEPFLPLMESAHRLGHRAVMSVVLLDALETAAERGRTWGGATLTAMEQDAARIVDRGLRVRIEHLLALAFAGSDGARAEIHAARAHSEAEHLLSHAASRVQAMRGHPWLVALGSASRAAPGARP